MIERLWPEAGGPQAVRRNALVLIVDDHPVFRQGLKSALQQPGITVVGEAATGREAVAMALALRPDIVLLDIRLPDMDGLQALKEIKARNSATTVIMITAFECPEYLEGSMAGGADGYYLKGCPSEMLLQMVRQAAGGESARPFADTGVPLGRATAGGSSAHPGDQKPPTEMTEREAEVLRGIAGGLTNEEIARRLGIRTGTVKSHIHHLYQKIQVADRTQAALWALRNGFTRPRSN